VVTIAHILNRAHVPEHLRDRARERVIIGTGKTKFDAHEVEPLVSALREWVAEVEAKASRKKAKAKAKKATADGNKVAASVKFRYEHKPRDFLHCPICKQTMEQVFLRGRRPVRYCPHHRVVLPIPVD